MKRLLSAVLLFLALPLPGMGQSLQLTIDSQTRQNSPSTFLLDGSNVNLSENYVVFKKSGVQLSRFVSYGISQDGSLVAALSQSFGKSEATLLSTGGDTLLTFEPPKIDTADPSTAIYPIAGGASVVRYNIARFDFFDLEGHRLASASNSSGSQGGESISELVMDPMGKTIVVYNPIIKRNGKDGSRARAFDGKNSFYDLYYSTDRTIADLKVTKNGQYVVLLTQKDGTNDEITVTDRFGNTLNTLSFDQKIQGFQLGEEGKYVTAFTQRRAMAYGLLSAKRIGSTSFRSTLVFADYFPQDHVIVGLTGKYYPQTGLINGGKIQLVHLTKRKIVDKQLGTSLGSSKKIPMRLQRTGTYRYELQGTSKVIHIRASF